MPNLVAIIWAAECYPTCTRRRALCGEERPDEPLSVLARLPFPMYVTAHPATLLEEMR